MKCFWFTILPLIFFSCENNELPENPEAREAIYREIAENPERMQEFRNVAMETEGGEMMMQNNEMDGMEHMRNTEMHGMQERNMQSMMKNRDSMQVMIRTMMEQCREDSVYCNVMADMMASNRPMMMNMMQHMHQEGMMSDECMHAMMQDINDVEGNSPAN